MTKPNPDVLAALDLYRALTPREKADVDRATQLVLKKFKQTLHGMTRDMKQAYISELIGVLLMLRDKSFDEPVED